jgi:hypothetical protein
MLTFIFSKHENTESVEQNFLILILHRISSQTGGILEDSVTRILLSTQYLTEAANRPENWILLLRILPLVNHYVCLQSWYTEMWTCLN